MKTEALFRRHWLARVSPRCDVLVLVALSALMSTADSRCSGGVPAHSKIGTPGVEVVRPIIERMQDAQARLKQGDTSSETRKVQGRVVDDLQNLIDEARRNASRNRQQDPGSGRGNAQRQDQSQKGQTSLAGSQPAAGLPSGSKANRGKPPAANGKPPAATIRPLWQAVWGHLPPTLRERVRNADFGETILPAYDDLVRRYFEALLDEPAEGKRQK